MYSKKRFILIASFILLTLMSLACLVGCKIDNVKKISLTPEEINITIGEFNYSDYTVTVTYDSGKTEQAVLTEKMLSAKDKVSLFVEGEHEITVKYKGKTVKVSVLVSRNVFSGVRFDDLDVVYNGEFYTVEVQNVPEGTTVTYPTTNRFRNAGEYEATAILRKDAYEMLELKARVNIRKADYDLSGITFGDKTVSYSGTTHAIEMQGTMPLGLYVDYSITKEGGKEEKGNSAQNAGVYTVKATFTGDLNNYNRVEPREAVLTIEQATIDMSAVSFADKTEVYDRSKHELKITGELPRGVSIAYENNEHVEAGEYQVTALFTVVDSVNYAPIPSKTAVLTIEKADYDMSGVQYNGSRVYYDGTEKKIEIQGQLPNGVEVSYENNVGLNAGTYQSIAHFTGTDRNYNNPESITATLIIDPIEAPMDQVIFERRRFIAHAKDYDNDELGEEEDYIEAGEEEYKEYLKLRDYNPYYVAMQYLPTNIPKGLTIKEVKYCKTEGWIEDLTVYDVNNDNFTFVDEITEDGYYIVVVLFEEQKNYLSVSPIRTQIRITTVISFTTWDILVYEEDYIDPRTGNKTGMFYDYNYGVCSLDWTQQRIGDIVFMYCDCNFFRDFFEYGEEKIIANKENYLSEQQREDYQSLTQNYFDFLNDFEQNEYNENVSEYSADSTLFADFMQSAEAAAFLGGEYAEHYSFDVDKAAFFGVNDGKNFVVTNSNGDRTLNDYRNFLAFLMGFGNADDFLSRVDDVINTLIANNYGASMASSEDQCVYRGSVYEKIGDNTVYIIPYAFYWNDFIYDDDLDYYEFVKYREFIYIFVSEDSNGVKMMGALFNDADMLFSILSYDGELYISVDGRCQVAEVPLDKWIPRVVTVTENGEEVEKELTNGKDFSFIESSEATDNLDIDRSVFIFRTDLPGNCSKESEGYSEEDYTVTTDKAVIKFCDDNPLSIILKNGGAVTEISKREDRGDHAQMGNETVQDFDELARLFSLFISNYEFSEQDIVNEWKLSTTNRNYTSYREFFDCAKTTFLLSNRNMGKNNEYVTSDSAVIGMNRHYAIYITGGANTYSVEQYRLAVAKLFGFTDLDTFSAYANALAAELKQNLRNANAQTIASRLLYDGAIYSENGYFVFPYVVKSSLSEKSVFMLAFVDQNGNMSVWVNNARNLISAVDFESTSGEKTQIEFFGRCVLFEDDGFIMMEDVDSGVLATVEALKGYNPFINGGKFGESREPVAIEVIKNISQPGDFLIYSTLTDTEGFELYLFSVYGYDNDSEPQRGFYAMVTIVSLDDLKASNQELIEYHESHQTEENDNV